VDEAIACYHKAIALDPKDAHAHKYLANALKKKGKVDEAIDCYRKAIELDRKDVHAYHELGALLCDLKRDYDGAIACFHKASELDPKDAKVHNNLGIALEAQGKVDDAIAEYREAIRLHKDYAEAHYKLGHAFAQKGQFRQAVEALRRGHQLGIRRDDWRHPSLFWLRQAEQMARFDDRLPAVLAGYDKAKNAAEYLGFAQLCQLYRHRYSAAANFYQEAFAAQAILATDLQGGHRYNAACAAAMAGSGQGKDADKLHDKERARLRRQALRWLRAELTARTKQLKSWWPGEAGQAREALQHWQQDRDLAGVRGEGLAELPAAERQLWQQLWDDVAGTLARAQGKKPENKSGAK
jgi:lipoprotein NlpI